MHPTTLKIANRVIYLLLITFALTPIVGSITTIQLGLMSVDDYIQWPVGIVLLSIYIILLGWIYTHFRHTLLTNDTQITKSKSIQNSNICYRLYGFSDRYWSFFMIYALMFPTVQHWFGQTITDDPAYISLLHHILLLLIISILVGIPGYLLTISYLGLAVQNTGLSLIHIRMKSKMLLIGGYFPMLASTLLLYAYWLNTEFISYQIFLAWFIINLISFTITIISIRSLNQSLSPVQDVIENSNVSSYNELAAKLRPRSIDEIGYLIQTLGRLFYRLGEQEDHMQAIVNNAAEGIIVINKQNCIETFNPAAEKLFGYSSQEIHGTSLDLLLPGLRNQFNTKSSFMREIEVGARHADGFDISVSIRVSHMQMEGHEYSTLMIADISDRKATEKMLIEAEARYRDLVETAHDLVWSMDVDGNWTYLNDAVFRIYGYTSREMLHKNFTDFQSPQSITRDKLAHTSMLEGKDLIKYETIHLDKDGTERHISFNARPQFDSDGNVTQITGTARDITEQKAYERELAYQAQHDSLTGLYNRNYFQQELDFVTEHCKQNNRTCSLLYMDLDQFKYINDTLGHAAGDRLLVECAELIRGNLRDDDLLVRFGGDEFIILLYNTAEINTHKIAQNLIDLFEQYRFFENKKSIHITCTIGITIINADTPDPDTALSRADIACNIAKSKGRNCIHYYDNDDHRKDGMAKDMGWASRVRDAFENDKFNLVYQPIISVEDGKIYDYEVLLRMAMNDGNIILPGGFMPAADRFGLVNQVDRWVVNKAIRKLASLHQSNNKIRFSINLSARAFEDQELLSIIKQILSETGLDPHSLTFEITETAAISKITEATRFITNLKDMGCLFALDDFGTGFSSFSYLKNLPVDKLKIDGSFVKDMANSVVDQAVVKSMNDIAHALGKKTIAEYVEDKKTYELLQSFGVDYVQGHYISKPLTTIESIRINEECTA